MQVFKLKPAFLKEIANFCLATSFSGVIVQDSGEITEKVCISTLVPQNSELGDKIARNAIQNIWPGGILVTSSGNSVSMPFVIANMGQLTWNPMPETVVVSENHYDHVLTFQ